jgi:hypothetical protein
MTEAVSDKGSAQVHRKLSTKRVLDELPAPAGAGLLTIAALPAARRMPPSIIMKLLQILLPAYDNQGRAFPKAMFDQVRAELAGAFGGVTAFLRSPAIGFWEDQSGQMQRDDVILFEVVLDALDRAWWRAYRRELEQRFTQEAILIRATEVEMM